MFIAVHIYNEYLLYKYFSTNLKTVSVVALYTISKQDNNIKDNYIFIYY